MSAVDLSNAAQAQKDALPPAQQREAGKMISHLGHNPHIGTAYQATDPVTWAYAGSILTICYTKSHPKHPQKLFVTAIFPTNLAPIDEYEDRKNR